MSVESEPKFEIVDTESDESRKKAHEKYLQFLRHAFPEGMSSQDKVEWIKKTDFHKFMDNLSVMNGLLTNENKFQRYQGSVTKSIVTMGFSGEDAADLIPPEKADKEFEKVFNQMKENISEENLERFATKIYTGIIFAHMFSNGNGRLARNVYYLLRTNKYPKERITTKRGLEILDFANRVSMQAITNIFNNDGIDVNNQEMQNYYFTRDRTSIGGFMDHLRYLAARRVLNKNTEIGKTIESNDLTLEEKKQYEKEFENIRKEWFHETQNVVDKYQIWANNTLDQSILEK